MKRTTKKIIEFLLHIFHGIKGSAIFFMISIMTFALIKIGYILTNNDLLLSRYTIGYVCAGFVLAGFIYGLFAYNKKNHHYKVYSMTKKNFLINLGLTIIFSLYVWYILRNRNTPSNTVILFGFLAFLLFYAFSALISHVHHHVKTRQHHKIKKSTIAFAVLFNPIFVIAYLYLFSLVVYGSSYVPCAVSVVGIDKNQYTVATRNLGISYGEQILTIDGHNITSTQDVRNYLNTLQASKEVAIETPRSIYLVKTYVQDNKRLMGLLLKQEICLRKY